MVSGEMNDTEDEVTGKWVCELGIPELGCKTGYFKATKKKRTTLKKSEILYLKY